MNLLFIFIAPFLFQSGGDTPKGYDTDLYKKAVQLSQQVIILDGHVDSPSFLMFGQHDISQDTKTKGEFDYVKGKIGGYDAPFMSIYIPSSLQKTSGESKKYADRLISKMDSVIAANPNQFAKALSPEDVRQNFKKGLISLPYGMENGSPIEDDLTNVAYFYNRGIRYITLTHSNYNLIGDSSYDPDKHWGGLSPFGYQVIDEMNRLGIMVDISHVSDSVFYQAIRYSKVPVICSHSSLRTFTPNFERNADDNMVKALAKKGGAIQINFGSSFITADANTYGDKRTAYLNSFKEKNKITSNNDPLIKAEREKYNKEHPYPFATIDDVVRHIDYAVKLVGVDHVGIGSDFDGVGDSMPIDLKSVADMPKLIYKLLKKGYSDQDIEKIMSGNVLRVWQQTIDYAKSVKGK